MPIDIWKPTPQPPCTEACCTGEAFTDPESRPKAVVIRDDPGLRSCGVTGCCYCPPVHTTPAGAGDRLPFGHRKA